MTNQEIFNEVVAAMREQKSKSYRNTDEEGFSCVYATGDARGCAVGKPLLNRGIIKYPCEFETAGMSTIACATENPQDEDYAEMMQRPKYINLLKALQAWGVTPEQYKLVYQLQRAHDHSSQHSFMRDFEAYAKKVAEDFDLVY